MKIAILSRNKNLYSTKRLAEAAIERGHTVEILDHLKCYVVILPGRPTIHYDGREITDIDAIIPRIGASVTFYGSAIVRQFEMMNIFSAVESQAIVRSRDKLRSMQILSRSGIDLPITGFARDLKDKQDLLKTVGGAPLVLKLLEGTQGLGVVLAETKKAAESVLDAFHGLNANILIQEFIKEAKGEDIRAFIVDGKVVGSMMRKSKEGEFRSNLHRGGTAQVVKLTRQEKAVALKAVKALGLSVAGVDMLRSERGPLVLEVNSSPGLEGIERATGKNIAGKVIEYIENNAGKRNKSKDKIGV